MLNSPVEKIEKKVISWIIKIKRVDIKMFDNSLILDSYLITLIKD